MELIKLINENTEVDPTYIFMGHESDTIDSDDEYITFTFNIMPTEANNSEYADEIIANLKIDADYLNKILAIIEKLRPIAIMGSPVKVEQAFYPNEGDFNIYIYVPFNHPLIEANFKKKLEEAEDEDPIWDQLEDDEEE